MQFDLKSHYKITIHCLCHGSLDQLAPCRTLKEDSIMDGKIFTCQVESAPNAAANMKNRNQLSKIYDITSDQNT